MKILPYLFDLFLIYFFFGASITRLLSGKKGRNRLDLKQLLKHIRGAVLRDRDILPEATISRAEEVEAQIVALLEENDPDKIKDFLAKHGELELNFVEYYICSSFSKESMESINNWGYPHVPDSDKPFPILSLFYLVKKSNELRLVEIGVPFKITGRYQPLMVLLACNFSLLPGQGI